MNLGEKIRKRREELGLNQVDLAELTGIPQGNLSRFETGHIQWPRGNCIVKLADALQVTTDYLLREEETDASN